MKTIAVLISIIALALASTDSEQWQSFKLTHSKSYTNILEEKVRYSIFQDNLKKIEAHNKNYDAGLVTWKMGATKFADMTEAEFRATLPAWDVEALKAARSNSASNRTIFSLPAGVSAPSSIDWRTQGAVTEVKNQGGCGGCWSFSATGALEGQYFLKTGELISFSEQNLIDCVTANTGCDGGVIQYSFDYIQQNGIESESDYPYETEKGTCRFQPSLSKTSCNGYTDIEYDNEDELYNAVGTVGPVSVAVNANGFQFYSSGVYNDLTCSTEVNHGILAVGYGSENGQDYWIVKNSWSENFGEAGYIRMVRGHDICGIALWSSYPNL